MKESIRRKLDRRCEEMHHHALQDVDRDSLLCLLVSTESLFIGLCTAQEMVNKFRIRKVPLILTKYILLNNSQVSHTGSTVSELVREVLGQKKSLTSAPPVAEETERPYCISGKSCLFVRGKKSKQTNKEQPPSDYPLNTTTSESGFKNRSVFTFYCHSNLNQF